MLLKNYSDLVVAANQNVKQGEYWLDKLSGDFEKNHFPYDYFTSTKEKQLDVMTFSFSRDMSSKLIKLSRESDYTLNIILTAGVMALLSKYSGKNDIVVGEPIIRQEEESDFLNTVLILRNAVQEHTTFKEFLLEVSRTMAEATENYSYPLEILMEKLNIPAGSNGNFPLFDTVILLKNIHDKRYIEHINVNMLFSFERNSESIEGVMEFNPLLYDERTVKRLWEHLRNLMGEVLLDPDTRLGDIDILSGEEKNLLLEGLNDTFLTRVTDKTVHALYEEQVKRTPAKIAFIHKDHYLTYDELNQRANRLAWMLRSKGVSRDSVVGLMVDRSVEMMIGILAVLKAGGAYTPLDIELPVKRVASMLKDSGISILLTRTTILEKHSFVVLQDAPTSGTSSYLTPPRPQIRDLDTLPFPDRSLINYDKYSPYISVAPVKHCISLQATRGCPYMCAYCHKIWPKKQVMRSAEDIFEEVKIYYDMGVRRFASVDDAFNLKLKNSSRFFELIIKNNMDVQLFFPPGLRGDVLTKDYIDLMVEAGVVNFALALETASPRLQKLIRKNLKIEKLRENMEYICKKYPQIILELQTMHGFPTETEEEAMQTLEFIQSMKWLHFPYVHTLRIYPNTDMEQVALENGVSREAIINSRNLAWHELPETLPFEKNFTLRYQTEFFNEYILSKERLLHVLPYQMKVMTEDEIVQKYNTNFPTDITSFSDILKLAEIDESELVSDGFLDKDFAYVPNLHEKMVKHFGPQESENDAYRLLMLDLTQFFSAGTNILYDVVEPPLGLMCLVTNLKKEYGKRIKGKVAKSRIDFDSFSELRALVEEFKPDMIGIRSIIYYKELFHKTVTMLRQWGIQVPIISGGPYATSESAAILQSSDVQLIVLGEGEETFIELIGHVLGNGGIMPDEETLKTIPGIAFIPEKVKRIGGFGRDIIMLDQLEGVLPAESSGNPEHAGQPGDLAYSLFTSGSTGNPKGTAVPHSALVNFVHSMNDRYNRGFGPSDICLSLTNIGFDVSVSELFMPLLLGSTVLLLPDGDIYDLEKLAETFVKRSVTYAYIPPGLLKDLYEQLNTYDSAIPLNKMLVGVEPIKDEMLENYLKLNPAMQIVNGYGPTETTICSTAYQYDSHDPQGEIVPIGTPLGNTKILLLDKQDRLAPMGVPGELCVSGDGISRGYLNRPELTAEKFVLNPYYPGELMYRTGDLVKWLPDGHMKFLGRMDHQVKVRGFRVELEGIANIIKAHKAVKEAVVTLLSENGADSSKYLCAYIVVEKETDREEINEYLKREIPKHMLPSYFVFLDNMPLTPAGKINRKALPSPEKETGKNYVGPRDEQEEKLAAIWANVLAVEKEKIGIDDNFFQLGGHSLKATTMISRIHKEFHVKLQLAKIFEAPTIRGMAEYLKEMSEVTFETIEPAKEKDYYALSSPQKRLYFLQKMEPTLTNYNIYLTVLLEGSIDRARLEETFARLIKRHANLRTSFEMVDENPMQRVHADVTFSVDTFEADEEKAGEIIQGYSRAFDLAKPPLLRAGLLKLAEEKHVLMVDMHHIITDGSSMSIFIREFMALYEGKELPALRLQYTDYSEWMNREKEKEAMKKQEAYWLGEFEGELPVLHLPTDLPRPKAPCFAGNTVSFKIGSRETASLKALVLEEESTLFILLLALFNILLSKLCDQEDIVVGTPVDGRRHDDLQGVMGMFVNTIALRNLPSGSRKFNEFLKEVKERTLTAFENRDYPLEKLVKRLGGRETGRNPLFDVMFALQNTEIPVVEIPGLQVRPYEEYERKTAQFDLVLTAAESGDQMVFAVEYRTDLFEGASILKFNEYFEQLIKVVSDNKKIRLEDIDISYDLPAQPLDVPGDDEGDFGF